MTKITVNQAVRAVQSATTAEEVQSVLEQCKKDQLHEVFLAVTGAESELCPKSWKKAELVRQYTARTIAFKAREAFSAMDAEARAEYLTSGKFQQDGNTVDKLTWKLSPYELIALNTALGVSFEEYKDIREGYHAIASLKSCIRRTVRSAHSVNEAKAPVVEISKPESKSVAAFKQWEENFKGKDEFAFYATNDYLALLDVIAASKVVVSKEVDTYAAHWYIESGRSSREFRRVLLNTDPRKVVKFLNAAVSENTDNQVNAMRIAMGLATVESISWQERITQRRISKLIASLEAESEVKPDYDASFDEAAYTPERQDNLAVLDDIPADHEPDVQGAKPVAPAKFIIGRHYQSRGLDKETVTFLGKVSRDYGYFVDSLNCYHRVKIVSSSTGEYASIAHKSGSFPADRVNAIHEVSEHEILSVANGTSILLNAENVIHSYEELEAKLAPKPAPVQEASATTYEAMRVAYEEYLDAEDKYLTSRKTDIAEKAKSDKAFRQYLTLLGRYRKEGMPKREEALNWIREYCEGKLFPVDSLKGRSFDELTELAHKCGLHEAFFKECDTRHDLAVKLIREAGIEDSEKTSYERKVEARKELQAEIHKLWQKRHALHKAQCIFGEDSADAKALGDVWDMYHDQADVLLGEYWRVCEALARERETIRRYEAGSQLADTLAMAEVVVHSEPEVQSEQGSKPKVTLSLKKKPHKTSRKSHRPSWVQFPQLKSKPSRHDQNSKPLMKPTKAASTIRVRKF